MPRLPCLTGFLGIGKFTIADDAVVDEADLGVNFFLDEASLGKSRAEYCAELLVELNPEVQGDWFPKKKVKALSLSLSPCVCVCVCVCARNG